MINFEDAEKTKVLESQILQSAINKEKKKNETAGFRYMVNGKVLIIMIPFVTGRIVDFFYRPYFPELLKKYYETDPKKSLTFFTLQNISYLVCSWFMLNITEKYEDKPLNLLLLFLNALQAFLIFPVRSIIK